jgi:hypothetical protein
MQAAGLQGVTIDGQAEYNLLLYPAQSLDFTPNLTGRRHLQHSCWQGSGWRIQPLGSRWLTALKPGETEYMSIAFPTSILDVDVRDNRRPLEHARQ